MYLAQYECLDITTTTTTMSTTTTSSTTTTTSTSTTTTFTTTTVTTTSSTTSTIKTTTAHMESQMLHDMQMDDTDLATAIAAFPESCNSKFMPPGVPDLATDHNGVQLADVCFKSRGPHRVFVIGDWGGILYGKSTVPVPAPERLSNSSAFVKGVDDVAQQRVANQMAYRAIHRKPDYVLNVGDNFYWGGIDERCGSPLDNKKKMAQMQYGFENVYTGAVMGTIPWLGVLGNHDYGGFRFDNGWDRLIGYTWGHGNIAHGGRWMMPAQYWRSRVHYPGFSVDYFFLDTNAFAAETPAADPIHNM